jgi:uncharacterized YigZ family protein
MARYLVPANTFRKESKLAKSRFISTIGYAPTVKSAKQFIAEVRKEFSDATHNVPVYLIGIGSSTISHCSDAGEPSGTAGRPALAVLNGSGLSDTVIVITRYFGGKKLGTGGLVKAYSNSARGAIDGVKKANKILFHQLSIDASYSYYEPIRKIIYRNNGIIDEEEFSDKVLISCVVPEENYPNLKLSLLDISQGDIIPQVIQEHIYRCVPIK